MISIFFTPLELGRCDDWRNILEWVPRRKLAVPRQNRTIMEFVDLYLLYTYCSNDRISKFVGIANGTRVAAVGQKFVAG